MKFPRFSPSASPIPLRRLTLALAACTAFIGLPAHAQETINALVWCDHTDEAFLKAVTAKTMTKTRVNVKDYEGTGTALSLIEQGKPGDWDVFVVEKKRLAELDPKAFPMNDIPAAVRLPEYPVVGGKMHAVPEKFGCNAIAHDKIKVTAA